MLWMYCNMNVIGHTFITAKETILALNINGKKVDVQINNEKTEYMPAEEK